MKTKKYLISMKTALTAVAIFALSFAANAQFTLPNPSNPNNQTMEEVRTGSSTTYSLVANHNADEQYRWAVIGGTITSNVNGALITSSGDSSIVEFSANTYEITVAWDEDLSATPIGSFDGEILVQKKTDPAGCPSQLQNLPIRQWNDATAEIDAGSADYEICSGDAVGGTITLNLTGAPDDGGGNGFEVIYDVRANNLTDLLGNALDATDVSSVTNAGTITLTLPDGLISSNTTGDETFEVELTSMHDDFNGAGAIVNKSVFTITVHPTVVTGDIVSGSSLTRRP